LAHNRLKVAFALVLLTATAFTLAACGRNGNPLLPPGPVAATPPPAAPSPVLGASTDASVAPAQANAAKNGFDSFGNPVAPPGQKKSFLLDPLLQ
jgi:predicted small lipoprotein YifL